MKRLNMKTKKKLRKSIAMIILAIILKALDVSGIDAYWCDILKLALGLSVLAIILRLLAPDNTNEEDNVPNSGTWKK